MTATWIKSLFIALILVYFGALLARGAENLCPQRKGSDPTDINGRIVKLNGKERYTVADDSNGYRYEIYICKQTSGDDTAVRQSTLPPKPPRQVKVGGYKIAAIRGGVDWFMITYGNGEKYTSHCGKTARKANVMVTCDPNADTGSMKIIEEYVTNSSLAKDEECYYLFELNNKAACSVRPKTLSPGSILIIVVIIVTTVYLLLGFLYQRFIVGAKGLEQIPNYNFWMNFGNLQADGCNFICRCTRVKTPPRYKTMDDEIGDDDEVKVDDDSMLPM